MDASSSTVVLKLLNTGRATAVFQVRSGNPADLVRNYTVEPGKYLEDSWNASPSYNLSVYGPNGFVRYFNGSVGPKTANLDVSSMYETDDRGSIQWTITNLASTHADVSVLDGYTGKVSTRLLHPNETFEDELSLDRFHGWYDLIVTVNGDSSFKYRLGGHVETGKDSFSDPALGCLVTLPG